MAALSENPLSQAWIAQFDVTDREAATRFLDSLVFVSASKFELALRSLIQRKADAISGPVAIYAVRNLTATASYFPKNPKVRPKIVEAEVGSEGRVANLVTTLARERPEKFINHATIAEMRKRKPRAMFLVDDFIGSGFRSQKFVHALLRSPTIKSWCSYGLLRFHFVAYAATESGTAVTRRASKHVVDVSNHRAPPTMAQWPAERRSEVVSLCRRYAPRTGRSDMALGFRDSQGTLVFSHGCPNNAPGVLWCGASKKWRALFPRRAVPDGLLSSASQDDALTAIRQSLASVGQGRLAHGEWITRASASTQSALLVLAAVARKIRNPEPLSSVTGLDVEGVSRVLLDLSAAGLLDGRGRITNRGLVELDHARRLGFSPDEIPSVPNRHYFPYSLRDQGGS